MQNFTKSTENIQPDSLTGAIFAIEGIEDACVILNGPTGCKFYHSAISDSQYLRGLSFETTKYSAAFYMGQPRVPSTYLDGHDYVFGSGQKLTSILRELIEGDYKLIVIVNSPGAALIGDDLEGFLAQEVRGTIPCFSIENTGYSGHFSAGHQNAIIKTLAAIDMNPCNIQENTVNLLGLSIYQKHFEENYQTLKSLLALCGIQVISAPGAGDDVATMQKITEARYNIVVYPEYGNLVATTLENTYGIPYVQLDNGLPIGFDATMGFVTQICQKLNADPAKAIAKIEKARAKAFLHLARFSSLTGLPKGAFFSVKAEASVCYALTKWLTTYLGMIPAAIDVLPDEDNISMQMLTDFLTQIDCASVLENHIIETPMHLLFADGNTIALARLKGKKVCGIELSLPTLGYTDVTDKYILGEEGALFLLEQIINGLRYLM